MEAMPADRSQTLAERAPTADLLTPPPIPDQKASYSSTSSSNVVTSESPSHYSSFSSSDSDEPSPRPEDGLADEDEDVASDVVGVSISRAQTRMKARTTPAEEKSAVLEDQGGYFASVPDVVHEDGLFVSEIMPEPRPVETEAKQQTAQVAPQQSSAVDGHTPTSAAKDTAAGDHRSSFTRSLLRTSLPRRPRAWSGELKRFLPDLGALTKRPSLSFRSGNTQSRARSQSQTVAESTKGSTRLHTSTLSLNRGPGASSETAKDPVYDNDDDEGDDVRPISELRSVDAASTAKHSYTQRPSVAMAARPPSLRRSSSDQSLYLQASSTASSLEQRPRYENVHSPINSRFKAFKDSLQSSSNRLINTPALRLNDIRADWGYRPFFQELAGGSSTAPDYGEPNGAEPHHRSLTPPPAPKKNPQTTHPILEEAMSELTGDVVVIGGYRGSVLRSAKPPHRQLWVPMKVGLNLRRADLELGLRREDEERAEEKIIANEILSHIGPVEVCRRLLKRLRKCDNAVRGDLRVWAWGYDWRLSPELISSQLVAFLENLPCNKPTREGEPPCGATVIAHSLGGLITRHAVNQRPDLFAGVLYAGTPQHCVNILGPLRNGDDVLLSSKVLTAQVNFSFRSSFVFLPEDGQCFIDKNTEEEYRLDFFDVRTWDENRLSPCIAPALPPTTAGKGFKDIPLIGKRFSVSARDEADDSASSSSSALDPSHHPDIHTIGKTDKDISARNPPRHQAHDSTSRSSKTSTSHHHHHHQHHTVDGIIGPASNPRGGSATTKAATTSTIPRTEAISYLQRTLSETKRFKAETAFRPSHQAENRYPPAAVMYGKTVPTVYGARVASREAIKHQDSFDDLTFAAGDGVCLAAAAMLPPGYRIIKNGLVKSDRGHVGLLGDLEGVGQCLRAIIRGRKEGVGLGTKI